MKEWGLTIASEKRMRIETAELIGDNLEAEWDPMFFNHKDGGEVIKEVPLAYIPRLWEKIESLLNQSSDDSRG